MSGSKKKPSEKDRSLKKAEAIILVQAGLISVTEAARRLGLSRKTYYKWEKRGLAGLMEALEDLPSGRAGPPPSSRREAELESELERIRRKNEDLEKLMNLRTMVHELELDVERDLAKKK